MPPLLRDFIEDTESLRRSFARIRTTQVNSITKRRELQTLVDHYFRDVRPSVVGPDVILMPADTMMQEILSLSHKRATTSIVKQMLSELKRELIELETTATCALPQSTGGPSVPPLDARVIETLQRLKPSAALAYEQALIDLAAEGRRSYRGPATDLREALRETLDHLAPDAEVTSQPGYRQDPNVAGPTMKQKARYVLSRRGPAGSETAENAAEAVDLAIGGFVRSVYTRSSVSTHTPTDRSEVLRVRELVRFVLCELLSIPPS